MRCDCSELELLPQLKHHLPWNMWMPCSDIHQVVPRSSENTLPKGILCSHLKNNSKNQFSLISFMQTSLSVRFSWRMLLFYAVCLYRNLTLSVSCLIQLTWAVSVAVVFYSSDMTPVYSNWVQPSIKIACSKLHYFQDNRAKKKLVNPETSTSAGLRVFSTAATATKWGSFVPPNFRITSLLL